MEELVLKAREFFTVWYKDKDLLITVNDKVHTYNSKKQNPEYLDIIIENEVRRFTEYYLKKNQLTERANEDVENTFMVEFLEAK